MAQALPMVAKPEHGIEPDFRVGWARPVQAMKITSKAQMYDLYHRGRFGNRLLAWRTLDEYLESGYAGEIVLRYAGDTGGKWCAYGLDKSEALETASAWESQGASRARIQANEAAPDGEIVFQGEVCEAPNGLALRYSTVPKPMRLALAEESRYANGLTALNLLKANLDPASMDDLRELLADFDGAAVEFSVWNQSVGDANRNTVFWEVRHY